MTTPSVLLVQPTTAGYSIGMDTSLQVPELKETLRTNLLHRRKELKLSQAALAERAGLTQALISYFEKGEKTPSLETIAILAEHLRTTPAALLSADSFSAAASANGK